METLNGLAPGTPLNLNHRYVDNGLFNVVLRVRDGDGGVGTRSFSVTVINVAPVISAGPDQTVPEGSTVLLSSTVTDAGANDIPTFRWSVVATNGQSVPIGTSPDFTFVPRDQGTYTVTLTVTDNAAASAVDTLIITVTDVSPTGSPEGPDTANEGIGWTLTVGPHIDPGSDTVTQYRIDWDDGSPVDLFTPEELNNLKRLVTHTFADEGARSVVVYMVDEDGSHVAGTKTLTVLNVAPVVTGLSADVTTVTENGLVSLSGTFADPGLLDGHTVKILWGDGTAEETITLAPETFTFSASHRYLDDAPSGTLSDPATISVRVNDGTVDSEPLTTGVTVTNVAPAFDALTVPGTLTENGSLAVSGTLVDPGTLDTLSVLVDWGDGAPPQTLSVNAAQAFSGSHVYAVPGNYSLQLTALDDDGGTTLETRQVAVDDIAPMIAATNLGLASL